MIMNKFIDRNMKEENTSYRPEQLLIAGLLREIDPFKKNYTIKTEHRVDLEILPFPTIPQRSNMHLSLLECSLFCKCYFSVYALCHSYHVLFLSF